LIKQELDQRRFSNGLLKQFRLPLREVKVRVYGKEKEILSLYLTLTRHPGPLPKGEGVRSSNDARCLNLFEF
jgi:hypothetical protein